MVGRCACDLDIFRKFILLLFPRFERSHLYRLRYYQSVYVVGILCPQLLQLYADLFESVQVFLLWSKDVHVILDIILRLSFITSSAL